MNPSLTFTREFSRLVSLLVHEAGNIEEQKTTLRAVVAASKAGPVSIALRGGRLEVDARPVPESFTAPLELPAQLAGHGVCEVAVDAAASASDLLGVARLLAAPPAAERPGDAIAARLQALAATTVRIALAERAPVASSELRAREAAARAAAARAAAVPRLGFVTDEDGGMFRHFSAPRAPQGSVGELLARLAEARGANEAAPILDDLGAVAENAALEGRPETIAEVLCGIVAREGATTNADVRRAYALALRRLTRPALLRAVAGLLPRQRERLEEYLTVLARAGEDGADALIEQLTQAPSIGERRVYFDALRQLQAGVPTLIHMLGDARWFIVRNAADLLGEMQAGDAEAPLAELLRHGDERVRRSAARALLQLGTRTASQAVHEAMRDQSPEVRAQIAGAIATRPDARTVITLTRALDDEGDTEVQLALIGALGRVATAEAVRRLATIAAPERRLFRRKASALRVAAVQALGEARTPQARAALRDLEADRDRSVREAVARALARGATAS